jgi:2-oxoglutarate ferredoxin oxidoreductase subunit beta
MRAQDAGEFLTGLIHFDPSRPGLAEVSTLTETPLAALPNDKLRPDRTSLERMMGRYS